MKHPSRSKEGGGAAVGQGQGLTPAGSKRGGRIDTLTLPFLFLPHLSFSSLSHCFFFLYSSLSLPTLSFFPPLLVSLVLSVSLSFLFLIPSISVSIGVHFLFVLSFLTLSAPVCVFSHSLLPSYLYLCLCLPHYPHLQVQPSRTTDGVPWGPSSTGLADPIGLGAAPAPQYGQHHWRARGGERCTVSTISSGLREAGAAGTDHVREPGRQRHLVPAGAQGPCPAQGSLLLSAGPVPGWRHTLCRLLPLCAGFCAPRLLMDLQCAQLQDCGLYGCALLLPCGLHAVLHQRHTLHGHRPPPLLCQAHDTLDMRSCHLHGLDPVCGHGLPTCLRRGHLQVHPWGGPVYLWASLFQGQWHAGLHAYVGCAHGSHTCCLWQAAPLRVSSPQDEACADGASHQSELDIPWPRGHWPGCCQLDRWLWPRAHATNPTGYPAEWACSQPAAAGHGRGQGWKAAGPYVLRDHTALPAPLVTLHRGLLLASVCESLRRAAPLPGHCCLDELRPGCRQPNRLLPAQQGPQEVPEDSRPLLGHRRCPSS